MSVVTFGNGTVDIAAETVTSLASNAGLTLKKQEVEDFRVLIDGLDKCIKDVEATDDYQPKVDLTKYPRTDIKIPSASENDKGGWATLVTVKCTEPTSELLSGRTVALKDNMALAGVRCTNGTKAVEWTPEIDCPVATRIMDAGGVINGKAACENACMEGVSDTSCTGAVHNPYADGYSCGGSSSGSGRVVATGSADMAIGCDQGGSIRIPASYCGLVGLKPTWGLVPYSGILSLEATIDHAGPMTKTVRDNALLLEAVAGPDGMDDRQQTGIPIPKYSTELDSFMSSTGGSLKGIKIGVMEEGFWDYDSHVDKIVSTAIEKFSELGATVEKVSIPSHKTASIVWMCALPVAGAKAGILADANGRKQLYMTDRIAKPGKKLSQEAFDSLGPGAQNLYMRCLFLEEKYGPDLHAKCTNILRKCSEDYDQALKQYDVLVMPTIPIPPCKLFGQDANVGVLERLSKTAGLIANCAPYNSTGHPALTIPVGFSPAKEDASVKLPVGLQLVGKKYCDLDCLKIGAAWEKAFQWKDMTA